MNLIQQLQQTSKWNEFEEWYSEQGFIIENIYGVNVYGGREYGFEDLDIEFQKGVFEKFIKNQGFEIHFDGSYNLYDSVGYVIVKNKLPNWEFFEDCLLWYFKQ